MIWLLILLQIAQPDLDLPVGPDNYRPGAPGVIPPESNEDPRDEPAPVFYGEEISAEDATIVYVIDISGSMKSEERMIKAKAEAKRSISALPESFRFNVYSFQCAIRQLWPEMKRADQAAKADALAFVESLKAFGATATGPGIAQALSDKETTTLVVLTDGIPSCGAGTVDDQ
jgi:hypothetical protein